MELIHQHMEERQQRLTITYNFFFWQVTEANNADLPTTQQTHKKNRCLPLKAKRKPTLQLKIKTLFKSWFHQTCLSSGFKFEFMIKKLNRDTNHDR